MGTRDALNNYILEVRDVPFEWGIHDCLTFTNEAWRRVYGEGWAEDWLGRYYKNHSYGKRLLRKELLQSEYGFFTFDAAVDSRLKRINYTPPRGALLATQKLSRWGIGHALGISMGSKGAFLSDKGVVYIPLEDIEKAWVKNDAS